MNLEQLKNLDKKYAQVIADYLLKRIETDECLNNKLLETNKTLKGCIAYVKSEARKQAEDSVAVLTDDEVFELVVHYYLEDSLDYEPKEPKQSKADKLKKKEVKKEETLFREEELEEITEDKKPAAKEEKPKKNVKEDLMDQLSLFDL